VLFVFLTYISAIVFYFNFYKDVDPLCDSLWNCFSYILDNTFKYDGGFTGNSPSNKYYEDWVFNYRVIFDFIYIFLIIILISQIISGKIFYF
jgi:hypothetical protein